MRSDAQPPRSDGGSRTRNFRSISTLLMYPDPASSQQAFEASGRSAEPYLAAASDLGNEGRDVGRLRSDHILGRHHGHGPRDPRWIRRRTTAAGGRRKSTLGPTLATASAARTA